MSVAETLETVLEKVRSLVQADSVVGNPIQTPDGATILPICRISVGFAAGGNANGSVSRDSVGTGAGAVITPVAFLVMRADKTELVPMDKSSWQFGRILDMVPDLLDRIQGKDKQDRKNSHKEP